MKNNQSEPNYEEIIENILTEFFREPEFTDEEWDLFKLQMFKDGLSVQSLVEDLKVGIQNGFSVETQLQLIRTVFNK